MSSKISTNKPLLTISPSIAKAWIRCHKSYYWRYITRLERVYKSPKLDLGSIASEVFAEYYNQIPQDRNQAMLNHTVSNILSSHEDSFLGINPNEAQKDNWAKISRIIPNVFNHYHDWAQKQDKDLKIVAVEHQYTIPLNPFIKLTAIPDTVVESHESRLILEHKLRSKYKVGDFGIDYQSVGSCLATKSIGTLYNVINYSKVKYHRDPIVRDIFELEYFYHVFLAIAKEIMSTPKEDMYPQPWGRCSCEYFELCMAEMTGIDIEDIVEELYKKREYHHRKTQVEENQEEG